MAWDSRTAGERMNLLYVVFNRVGRGTYWRAIGFARELSSRGHKVTLLAAAPQPDHGFSRREVDGVTVVQMPDRHRGSGYDLWHMWQRINWVQGKRFDLVHIFETRPTTIGPALYLHYGQEIPLVTDWCDWFGRGGSVEERSSFWLRTGLRPVETFFEERFRTRANGTTVINSVLHDKAVALGVAPQQILLLPNGANVDEICPQDQSSVQIQLGLPPSAFYLAYTGSIFRRDAELMAGAFNIIQAARPDARLLLIGYCNIRVEDLVHAPETMIRTGQITYQQLANYVAAADIGWLPLRNRGANQGRFPMKAHDFMAAGRPLVVTAVGDLSDLVESRKIGSVAADNAVALAEKTLALMEDPVQRKEMGRRARRVAETEFAWPVVTDLLESWYLQWKK